MSEEAQATKKDISAMTIGLREELDEIKARLLSVSSTAGSGSSAAAASGELRSELDALASELVQLRSAIGSGSSAAAPHGGGGKLGGGHAMEKHDP